MSGNQSFRSAVQRVFQKPQFLLGIIIVFTLLTISINSGAYFFGLVVVAILLWGNEWKWRTINFVRVSNWMKLLMDAFIWTLVSFFIIDIIFTPLSELLLDTNIDLASFDHLRGNLTNYIIFLCLMWVVAAFGEEFVYRGLIQNQLSKLFGGTNYAPYMALIVTSVLFGLAHRYQGVSGMLTTGLMGLIIGWLFIKSPNRLWLCILVHGLYDTLGLTLIFLDQERLLVDMVKSIFSN